MPAVAMALCVWAAAAAAAAPTVCGGRPDESIEELMLSSGGDFGGV